MTENLATKVVLKQTFLNGSTDPYLLQRVATVYINGNEYRVSAPPEAKGKSIEWVPHFTVRQLVDFNSEVEIHDAFGILALKLVKEELEKNKRDEGRAMGMNPDGIHCDAQICLRGHVQHCDGMPFDPKAHCTLCGSPCIDECPHCREPIRGAAINAKFQYSKPRFCHGCGHPYPWMEELLMTARELLYHDDKLEQEDRDKLWKSLQYVMSDPKADLAPEKTKLISIMLEKAAKPVRDAILDLIAKIAVESMKG